jgi:iron(III) transport system permease protein
VNSITLALMAAIICVGLSMVLSYFVVRRPGRFAGLVNYVATMPLAIPHVVFAVALIWLWVGTPFGIYNSRWILLLAYVAMFLPYAMQASVNAFRQLDPVLEEAGRMGGASSGRIAGRIILPLLVPAALSGATIVLYNTMQEISASLILYSPNSTVITVAIWGLYRNGIYPQLFAMAIIYIILILALVLLATALARTQRNAR